MDATALINGLSNLPNRVGQIVLHAVRDDFEVEVRYRAGTTAAGITSSVP
jgi:hypothetical protein